MGKRIPRVTDPSKPPHNAVHFDVWRLRRLEGTNKNGGRYTTWKPQRLTGGVGPDGRVSDRWLLAELSPEAILARWGSGRYRIRYLGAAYDLVGSVDWELQATPENQGEPLTPPAATAAAAAGDGSPASRIRGLAGSLDGAGVVELMLLLNDARESASRIAREEADRRERAALADADRRAQRDQTFFDRMMQVQHAAPAAAAASGPPVDMARELALLRRELSLTVREESARLRAEVLSQIPEAEAADGAETFTEALNGAGVGLVEGLGAEMPSLVSDGLGKLRQWLRMNGQPDNPAAVVAAIEAVKQAALAEAAANGASS